MSGAPSHLQLVCADEARTLRLTLAARGGLRVSGGLLSRAPTARGFPQTLVPCVSEQGLLLERLSLPSAEKDRGER